MDDFTKEIEFLKERIGGAWPFEGCILAGGAITSVFTKKDISDFDLYFHSRKAFDAAVHSAYDQGYWCVSITSRAITFAQGDLVFQLMHFRFFPDANAIFESFDFTCCMAALPMDSQQLVFHPRFLADTNKRELIFNHGTDFPLASGVRVLKYQQRGYTISKTELIKLLVAVTRTKIDSWDELKEQIGGHYGEKVTVDTSKEFNPANLTAALESVRFEPGCDSVENPATAEEALAKIWKEPYPGE